MNYNTDFVCTYMLHDDINKEDLYRIQMLQAFNIKEWDDDKVNETIINIYEKIKFDENFDLIIKKSLQSEEINYLLSIFGKDPLSVFKLLFKYELFTYTHKCICEFLSSGSISKITKDNLINNL